MRAESKAQNPLCIGLGALGKERKAVHPIAFKGAGSYLCLLKVGDLCSIRCYLYIASFGS